MNITLKGIVKHISIGTGAWAFESDEGKTYQIFKRTCPEEVLEEGKTLSIEGKLRDDIMSNAMIGPVLEIVSYTIIVS